MHQKPELELRGNFHHLNYLEGVDVWFSAPPTFLHHCKQNPIKYYNVCDKYLFAQTTGTFIINEVWNYIPTI